MNQAAKVMLALLAALLVAAPFAAAHPRATTVQAAGERCYIYTNDAQVPEYWVETNGVLDGGVPGGTPVDHVTGGNPAGSGLQRSAGSWGAADTRVDELGFAERCFA